MKPELMDDLKSYQSPELKKIGSVNDLTQQPLPDGISGDLD